MTSGISGRFRFVPPEASCTRPHAAFQGTAAGWPPLDLHPIELVDQVVEFVGSLDRRLHLGKG
ncbi:MAG: hypothetical protein ACYC6Y_22080, partial [Thermoguttaceae bacterium]